MRDNAEKQRRYREKLTRDVMAGRVLRQSLTMNLEIAAKTLRMAPSLLRGEYRGFVACLVMLAQQADLEHPDREYLEGLLD